MIIEIIIEIGYKLGWFAFSYFLRNALDRWLKNKEKTLNQNHLNISDSLQDIYGSKFLKILIKERNINYDDLINIFYSVSSLQNILEEKKPLTTKQIKQLSEQFHIPQLAFYPIAH